MGPRRTASSCFTLVSPGYRAAAGRLAVGVGGDLVAELDDTDLAESWQSAQDLSPAEAAELADAAAEHLAEVLAEGIDAAEIADAATDAAVVFLIAMKRRGISDPKRIPACTVMWRGPGMPEQVVFSA